MSRHNEQLYTPGSQTPGREIVNFDGDIQAQADRLAAKSREIALQIKQTQLEIDSIYSTVGQLVAEGGDWQAEIARVGKLQLEIGALSEGVKYIDGQIGLLRRYNNWLG